MKAEDSAPTGAEAKKIGISDAFDESKLAGIIDHTLLNPDATDAQLIQLCEEAKQYGFATVCVYSTHIPLTAEQLKNSPVKPIAVVDFPKGEGPSQAKAAEAQQAIRAGAKEIDMVIHIGALKSKNYGYVFSDIKAVVDAAKPHTVKVIIETAKLTDVEKIAACTLAKAAGAAFVKTSTGFGGGGATVEDVALMRQVVGPDIGVKASGGIRTRADALKMVQAGANRIGASAGIAIVQD
ncbi:deoxyribose-phosphate aldolase [Acidobacteriota bacterium]